ncbi:MAG: transposase, partial [Burkholderiales bacterium]
MNNQANEHYVNHKFTNNLEGYDKFVNWLEKKNIAINQVLICLENTGIYHRSLVDYLLSKGCFVWIENPVSIKWSIGLQRGKNDQVDAQRICLYAFRNQDKALAYQAKDQTIDKIAELLSSRERLVKAKKMLMIPIQELKAVGLTSQAELVANSCQESLAAL